MVSLKQLYEWFTTGKFPTQAQFAEQFKSFWHKSEKIDQSSILGLSDALDNKASKEELANATTKFKGYYSTLVELQTAYPQIENKKDFFAWVGSPYPGTVWKVKVNGGAWTDTGEVPTQPEIDLAEYAKKDQIVTEETDEETVSIMDESNHAVAVWTKSGTFDTPRFSSRLINQVKDEAEIATEYNDKNGVFIADNLGHAVALWDRNGTFDTPRLSKRLLELIADYVGSGGQTKPEFYADVYLIPCYGQSLSINTSAGASTFSYVEPLSHDVNLNNTNIQDMCAGTAEMFSIMADMTGHSLPENFKIMHCLGGTGGISVAALSKGSAYYNNVINSVWTAKATCDAQGLTLNVPAFTWTQGEEDMRAGGNPANYGSGNFDPFTYKNRLKQLIDDFNADIKSITGQQNDVLCVSYQAASHTTYCRYPRIALQQAELAIEDDRMIIAKSMYDIDYVTESNYQVHAPARSYRNMGNLYGIAIWNACVMRKVQKGVYPIHHSVNGNQVLIKFNVPSKPLALDTTLINQLPDGNYGFCFYNVDEQNGASGSITKAGTTITNVALQGVDSVLLTLNRTPQSGERLTYAINGDYWQNIAGSLVVSTGGEGANGIMKSGWQYGSRGCLRDSQTVKNDNPGAVFKDLFNWCQIFEIKF